MTGAAGDVFCVLFSFFDDFFRAGHTRAERWLRAAGHLLQGASPIILSILFGCFWPSGVFLLLLGGWVPLAACFPAFSPWFLGGRVLRFCSFFLLCALASSISL